MNNRTLIAAILLAAVPMLAGAQAATTPPKPKAAKPAVAAPAAKPAPAPAPATKPAPAPVAAAPKPTAPPPLPAPTGPIGTVALVTGSVKVGERSLGGGDLINEGDTIVVGPNSYANLKFNDGGRVLLRPNTEFAVESFRTRAPLPAAGATSPTGPAVAQGNIEGMAVFRLVRGGLRAISGLIGHGEQQTYALKTPAATIGIRGTDYEAQTCSDDCEAQATAATGSTEVAANELAGLELAEANGGGALGVLLATNEGSVVLKTPRGEVVIDAGHVAVALRDGQLHLLPRVPDALLRTPTPSPKACE